MLKSVTALLNSSRTLGLLVILGSMLFFCAIDAQAGQVTLAWDANTKPEPNRTGYSINWGEASGKYTASKELGNQTTGTIDGLQDGKTYYFAVKAVGYDSNGKPIESDFSNEVSQTIGAPPGNSGNCRPCTLWANGATPRIGADPDTAAVELGVKFKSGVNGYITGIRFYKDSGNTGAHIGNLWTNSGTRLATATFTNETASGWQQVNFPSPVPITANTVYIASYHTRTGRYIASQYDFSGKGVDSGPLHALADGVAGPNGVYAYSASSRFPNQSWRSSNYWVDVIFTTQ